MCANQWIRDVGKIASLVLLGGLATDARRAAAGTANVLTPEEQAAGFVLLFNGRDLSGWTPNGKPGSFTVRDGVIVADRTGRSDLAYWLSTDRQYGDFELRLQYKLSPGGNSGIFIRAPHEGRTSRMGMEIQLLDDGMRTGSPGVGDTGAIYRVVAAKAYVSRPAGQWNDLTILCEADRVRVTLNGQLINDARMTEYPELAARPRKGYIGLSAHTRPTEFRTIRLREIGPTPPAEPAATGPAGAFSIERDADRIFVRGPDGHPVLGYVIAKPADSRLTAASTCCLHPICTPLGENLTAFAPQDHRHHRGGFLAWYAMEGHTKADFWGWGQFAPTTGRVIENRLIEPGPVDPHRANLRVHNDWMAEGRRMIREQLEIIASRRPPANVIDLAYRLVPEEDVRLERSAFGGFCVRFRNDGKYRVSDPDGEVRLENPHYLKPETNWPSRDWYACSIDLGGTRQFGLAVMSHPGNPASTWHNPRTVWMLNPCITASGPVTLTKGEPLVLRYRLVAYDGPTPADLLRSLWGQWRGP